MQKVFHRTNLSREQRIWQHAVISSRGFVSYIFANERKCKGSKILLYNVLCVKICLTQFPWPRTGITYLFVERYFAMWKDGTNSWKIQSNPIGKTPNYWLRLQAWQFHVCQFSVLPYNLNQTLPCLVAWDSTNTHKSGGIATSVHAPMFYMMPTMSGVSGLLCHSLIGWLKESCDLVICLFHAGLSIIWNVTISWLQFSSLGQQVKISWFVCHLEIDNVDSSLLDSFDGVCPCLANSFTWNTSSVV